MAAYRLTWNGFLIRLGVALALVLATFNPSGYSYFHWLKGSLPESVSALQAFSGVIMVIGWVMFIRAGRRSLGFMGFVLASAFFATLFWLMMDWGLLSAENIDAVTWLVEVLLAGVLAIGMSWSHIRRRLSGQVDVDDAEDNL
ncbi:MAG: DUF6524 family protein [Lysobacterales bacterium]|nr:DUF6524 family protein [Gammaproteobacteria bacterium]MCZ6912699.1 DUF6524 family protein [Pseudomonadota bacterium]